VLDLLDLLDRSNTPTASRTCEVRKKNEYVLVDQLSTFPQDAEFGSRCWTRSNRSNTWGSIGPSIADLPTVAFWHDPAALLGVLDHVVDAC
jgi:hypothetical protein